LNDTVRSWASTLNPARLLHLLPQGTVKVGVGLLIQGLTAYAFLVVSARALGPERYVGVSVLWALTFLVAFGLFIPLEQELARGLAARTATGRGLSVRQVALAGTWVLVAVLLATLLGAPVLLGRLFDHQVLLLVGLGVSLPGYFLVHLVRGIFAGTDALARYGVLLAVEGCVRLCACLILAVAGSKSVGLYGLAFAVSPFVAVALTLRRKHIPLNPGTEASLATLSTALGELVAGSVLSQVHADLPRPMGEGAIVTPGSR